MNNDLLSERWHIDMDWYRTNDCSFLTLVESSLCPACRKRLKDMAEASEAIETVATCCAKKARFITTTMPVMASVFRLFLSHRNQPLTLEEIATELGRSRGGRSSISPLVLYRILMSDRYYGLQPVPEEVRQS